MATLSCSYTSSDKLVQLIRAATSGREGMLVRILDTNRLALGIDPLRPTHVVDLSTEQFGPYNPTEPTKSSERLSISAPAGFETPASYEHGSKITRRTGDYWLEVNGRRIDCRSLKELLSEGLRTLEETRPGTLEKLSHIRPRSRRIVARDPKDLFEKQHLMKRYSERLMNGWWVGTNNSAAETDNWLQRACSCAGLEWGQDFKTSLTLSLDALDL